MLGRTPRTWPLLVVVPSVALAATLALARPQEAKEKVEAKSPFRYNGADSCVACHRTPENTAYPKSLVHVKLDEHTVWKNVDKHSLAYDKLSSDRGKEMGKGLGRDVLDRETGCLNCHSASVAEVKDRKSNRPGDAFKLSDGVSCENCHGPSSEWVGKHFQSEWRAETPKEKASLGMVDLREPVSQAEKCLSCHVGNSAEKKVVTHAMYAVGHPPLPSIDVSWFSDAIPRHWRLLAEKPDQPEPVYHKAGDGLERSRLAVVGAATALKTSMKLIADEAGVEGSKVPGHAWPDYARFDCASCHHELERPSWRQERGYDGPPGRPPLNRWPLVVLSIGIDRIEREDPTAKGLLDQLKDHEESLRKVTRARPFGRKNEIAQAANDFAKWAEGLADRLAKQKYDAAAVKEILVKLITEATKSDLDYESARYVAWTASSLLKDLDRDPRPASYGMPVDRAPKADPTLKPIFDRLTKGLHLDLPTGQKVEIESSLSGALQKMGDYDPRQFRADLTELLPLIEK